ncbi:unnamed protein product [Arctogadus glacialis]
MEEVRAREQSDPRPPRHPDCIHLNTDRSCTPLHPLSTPLTSTLTTRLTTTQSRDEGTRPNAAHMEALGTDPLGKSEPRSNLSSILCSPAPEPSACTAPPPCTPLSVLRRPSPATRVGEDRLV